MREQMADIIARYYNQANEFNTVIFDGDIEETYIVNLTLKTTHFLPNEPSAIDEIIEQLLNANEIIYISKGIIPTLKTELFDRDLQDHEKIKAYNLLLEMYYCEDQTK